MSSTYGPWQRWFAWRPVETRNHGWRWLRTVERRRHYPDPMLPPLIGAQPGWEYRPTPNNRHETEENK